MICLLTGPRGQALYFTMRGVMPMKTFSEVCKIVGITRKTRRGYDEAGLISPADKTENGYWLYSDDDVKTLLIIQVLVEAGYERKRIRDMLNSPATDIFAELDNVIKTLEERKKRIDGMINTVRTVQLAARLPQNVLMAFNHADVGQMYRDKSFAQYLNESIESASSNTDDDFQEAQVFIPLVYDLVAIGCLNGQKPDDDMVRSCIHDIANRMTDLMRSEITEDEMKELEEADPQGKAAMWIYLVEQMLADSEFAAAIDQQAGPKASQFIIQAFLLLRFRTMR